jgi:Co/Zn/Cd efflux system component
MRAIMSKSLVKTIFEIPKMDCLSEERIIKMKLDEVEGIKNLDFNIPQRQLSIIHDGSPDLILKALIPLKFGVTIMSSANADLTTETISSIDTAGEFKLLKNLMAINASMFFVELIIGVYAESMGLISDSLDMLADSGVYLISLYAVGKSLQVKKKSALTNGIFQIVLGLGIIFETIRRFIYGSDPEPAYMVLISLIALAANVYCLVLLSKYKEGEVHLKASYICSSTDVMANIGVIIAGVLVYLTKSPYPDLIIGIIVTGIVLRGAGSILQLAK